MKIGILTSLGMTYDAFFPPIVHRMKELGHEVVSAASTPSITSFSHSILKTVTRNPSLVNIFAPKEIAEWAETESLDVIITNTATVSFLARVRSMDTPVIYFCHGLHWNTGSSLSDRTWQGLETWALKRTDAVVTINDDDETWFSDRMNPNSVHRLQGGVGVPLNVFLRTPIPPVEHKVKILWAGEFSKRKRPWLAIELMSQLLQRGVNIELTMCGEGPYFDSIQEKVNQWSLQKAVKLPGRRTNIAPLLIESHALLLTSAWEGLPRIGLEAVAVGRPVFAFDVKGTRSLPNVLTVPDLEVDKLANLIEENIQGGFSNISLADRNNLHPISAADNLLTIAKHLIDKPK